MKYSKEIESKPFVRVPDKKLHQDKETDKIKAGGKENANIRTDSKDISSEEQ